MSNPDSPHEHVREILSALVVDGADRTDDEAVHLRRDAAVIEDVLRTADFDPQAYMQTEVRRALQV